jgi:hypothetical protein
MAVLDAEGTSASTVGDHTCSGSARGAVGRIAVGRVVLAGWVGPAIDRRVRHGYAQAQRLVDPPLDLARKPTSRPAAGAKFGEHVPAVLSVLEATAEHLYAGVEQDSIAHVVPRPKSLGTEVVEPSAASRAENQRRAPSKESIRYRCTIRETLCHRSLTTEEPPVPRGSRSPATTAITIPASPADREHLVKAIDYLVGLAQARRDENGAGLSMAEELLAQHVLSWTAQIRNAAESPNGHVEYALSGQ